MPNTLLSDCPDCASTTELVNGIEHCPDCDWWPTQGSD